MMNILKANAIVISGVMALMVFSCDSKKSEYAEQQHVDSLMITYKALTDSVQQNWDVMIADDDEKLQLMKRLLLEVSYTNNYDRSKFENLNTLVDELKVSRYDQKSMRDSDLIDAYDSATWQVTDQIIQFARSHPRFEDFPLMQELIEDIHGKNNYVLMHRIHYDNWVKELNAFKKKYAKELIDEHPSHNFESMPLFQLPT